MMAAPRRVRIADVAAQAGVGVGTVSRVLNRSPHVSDSTRQRVLDAIKATSYRPSRLAADGAAAAAELAAGLLRQPNRPTAIFAASDTQAVGVLSAADATGLPVPGDLSVIGFDDIDTAAQWSLSTVRQPLRESGTRGAVRLCQLPRGEAVRPRREVLPLELIVRGSTTAACGRRTADRAGPARPEPAGSRSRLSLARAL
jgi:DNA-binding LacI/PurR family transcriptional regulator